MTSNTIPQAPIGTKWCNSGRHFIPLTQFDKGKGKDGLSSACKECRRAYMRAHADEYNARRALYRAANKEKIKEQNKRTYERHKLQRQQRCAEYRRHNIANIRLQQREAYQREREPRIAASRARYASKRDEILERDRGRYRKHPERWKVYSRLRATRKRAAPGKCMPKQWLDKCEFWGWRCYLCGVDLRGKIIHMEHRRPIVRGGSNWPANLAPACPKCNKAKHTKTEQEYRALLVA